MRSTFTRCLTTYHLPPRFRCASWATRPGTSKSNFLAVIPRAGLSLGLSGGDILNICMNAIHAGSADADPAKWRVTQGALEREIETARVAKAEHEGKMRREKRVIGSGAAAS